MASIVYSGEYQDFLKRLHKARKLAKLTQVQVAKRLNKQQTYVSKCELGERRVDAVELKHFALLYQKPLDFFLKKNKPPLA